MKKQKQDYFDFENDVDSIFKGYPPPKLKKPENIKEFEKVKVLGFGHIKHFIETNNTDEIQYSYFNLQKKQKKDYCYMKQYDIVIPVLSATNHFSILYVDKQPKEKMLYNATVLVMRLKDTSLSKYLYVMLNSSPIQKNISKLAYREKAAISYRMTVDVIKSLKIPMMDKDKMEKIISDYNKLQKNKIEIQEQEKEFWKNVDTLEEFKNLI